LQFRIKSRHRGANKAELPPVQAGKLDGGLVRGGAAARVPVKVGGARTRPVRC